MEEKNKMEKMDNLPKITKDELLNAITRGVNIAFKNYSGGWMSCEFIERAISEGVKQAMIVHSKDKK